MVAVINIQFLKSDTQMKSPAAKATLFLLPAFSEPIKPKQIQIHLLIQFRPIKFLPFFLGFGCSALPNRPSQSQGTRCYRLFWLRKFSLPSTFCWGLVASVSLFYYPYGQIQRRKAARTHTHMCAPSLTPLADHFNELFYILKFLCCPFCFRNIQTPNVLQRRPS